MFSEALGNLKDALFDEPAPKRLLATSINTTTNKVARLYGSPIYPDEIAEKQRAIAQYIDNYGLKPNDETVRGTTLEIIGRSELSGLSWDELDREFDKDPELEMQFYDQSAAVELALEQMQGGMPIRYDMESTTAVVQGPGGSKLGSVLASLIFIGSAVAVAGYSYLKNRSNNNENNDNGPSEQDIYNSNIAGLKDYEKAFLEARYGQANAGVNEDWDLDKQTNKDEAKINPHYIFDPTNSHDDSLSEESVRYVDRLVAYDAEHNPNNLLPDLYGNDSLVKAIDLVEAHPEVPADFTPRECHIMAKLPKYTPRAMDKPVQVKGVVPNIDDVVYDDKLDTVEGEDYVWSNLVGPALNQMFDLQQDGDIDMGGLTAEEAGYVLFPEEIVGINIKTGVRTGPWPAARLACGVDNVTPDESLVGKSPQQWLRNVIKDSVEAEDELYGMAIYGAFGVPQHAWPHSTEVYWKKLNETMINEPFVVAIMGYPAALGMHHVEKMTEQGSGAYSVLIGREFGIPVYDIYADYPKVGGGHSEPHVRMSNGEYIGFWMDKEAFLKDYEGSGTLPNLTQIYVGDDRWVPFKLD